MRRILSLDGGGIRGIFTLQILRRIESLFRQQRNNDQLVLADVFDLIAGTSTGAIIAAFLSWGKSVDEIEKLYVDFGPVMFRKQWWWRRWWAKYSPVEIARFFQEHFSENGVPALMGSSRLRTKLLIVMRNATTGSPWPVTNHPLARYNDTRREDCNLNIPLWQLLRASTAAPTFFAPETIDYGHRRFLFVDGGITPYNNPALIAVLTATLPAYKIEWEATRETLHVTSVGTGFERARLPAKLADQIHLKDHLMFCIPALLGTVAIQQDLLCRVLGDCVYGDVIDRELDDLRRATLLPSDQQKFTYVRYNRIFNQSDELTAGKSRLDMTLDRVENMTTFQKLGLEYADEHVRAEHFEPRRTATAAGVA
jgi:hypothetical protein